MCSAATRCSAAAPAPPGGASATSRQSSNPSGPVCSRCRPRPSCTPATATPPRSARKPPISKSGCAAATDGRTALLRRGCRGTGLLHVDDFRDTAVTPCSGDEEGNRDSAGGDDDKLEHANDLF